MLRKRNGINFGKNKFMKYIGILFVVMGLWIAFEMWRAPLAEETEDGGFKIIKPGKKLKDLFKRKNKNNSGSYSDLEKLGRGRSKF